MKIKQYIKYNQTSFNKDLELFFNKFKSNSIIHRAMWYSINNGGKRLRPIIFQEISKGIGLKKNEYLYAMLSIELMHSYSLVHDDLPSMDNDDYRRGKLSTHKKFNEAQAILAGNGLLTLAFELLSTKYPSILSRELSYASGSKGLAGGQSIDLISQTNQTNLRKILNIHELKTAKLFEFSVAAPFMIVQDMRRLKIAKRYGLLLGKTFQIIDDLIDQDQDEDACNILNYISKEKALSYCYEYRNEATKHLKKLMLDNENRLSDIFDFIVYQVK
jgi:geranylgeranyl diphosphate synthase type II